MGAHFICQITNNITAKNRSICNIERLPVLLLFLASSDFVNIFTNLIDRIFLVIIRLFEFYDRDRIKWFIAIRICKRIIEHSNIRLFAFDDQFDITCNLDHYMDVIHYSEDIGDQLLEWMAAGEHMLTNDNVDRYFDRITDFYANYDYDSIYE